MEKIFVVFGSTGEYSDYREWQVIATDDRDKADEYAKMCKELSDELYKEAGFNEDRFHYPHYDVVHKLNPHFKSNYSGTDYSVGEVTWLANNG